jgi:adenosyl cobinamide kinase/adenosyl cobinamide phosphate guanylyltransferase
VTLVLLLGGARSGKSRLAQQLAADAGMPVTVVATATAGDQEMAEKIAAHRAERPPTWTTLEEPFDLAAAFATIPDGRTVIVDCLTLWVSNLLDRGDEPGAVLELAGATCAAVSGRFHTTIVVSNEVGLGIVPANELGRAYRDLLGKVNTLWAARADRAWFTIAGRALPLAGVEEIRGV